MKSKFESLDQKKIQNFIQSHKLDLSKILGGTIVSTSGNDHAAGGGCCWTDEWNNATSETPHGNNDQDFKYLTENDCIIVPIGGGVPIYRQNNGR